MKARAEAGAVMILGIDVGGSTTKIVGLDTNGDCIGMLQVQANDQITSAFGAFGKFTTTHGLRMGDIRQIVLTGVGASYIGTSMYDLPTKRVDEFQAIGLGGLKLARLDSALMVSMGTGTALVKVANGCITHLGGSGVGGGTLLNLANRFAGASSFTSIAELAAQGNLSAVDLTLGDISKESIGHLPPTTTVANFGNLHDNAAPADIVLGLINMIFESIGMMAIFACMDDKKENDKNGKIDKSKTIHDIVLVGSLSTLKHASKVLDSLSAMYPVRFHIPPNAIYATAVGAALSEFDARH